VYCGFFTLALAVHALGRSERPRMLRGMAVALGAFLLLACVGPVLPFVKLRSSSSPAPASDPAPGPEGRPRTAIGLLLLAAALGVLSAACLPEADAVKIPSGLSWESPRAGPT
jgi:hypothetical protein